MIDQIKSTPTCYVMLGQAYQSSGSVCSLGSAPPPPQDLVSDAPDIQEHDASGNPVLKDIGKWLKKQLKVAFPTSDIKYIDPSYLIRCASSICISFMQHCYILAHTCFCNRGDVQSWAEAETIRRVCAMLDGASD